MNTQSSLALVAALLSANSVVAAPISDTQKLHQLMKSYWRYTMVRYPERATDAGYPGQNDRWTDYSEEAIAKDREKERFWLRAAKGINPHHLWGVDVTNLKLLIYKLREQVNARRFPSELLPIFQMEGFHVQAEMALSQMPTKSASDFYDRIKRLKALPKLIQQTQYWMEKGIEKQMTFPKIIMLQVPKQIDGLIEGEVEANPLFQSFLEIPSVVDPKEKEEILAEAKRVLSETVIPELVRFNAFLKEKYLPACRESIDWKSLPGGEAWYAFLVKHHTTTDLTPAEIHQIGLNEVERIRSEMDKIRTVMGYSSLVEMSEALKKDSSQFAKTKEEFLGRFTSLKAKMDPLLDLIFKRRPQLDCEIKLVPEFSQASQPKAYMVPGSLSQGRNSVFYANFYDPTVIPFWGMPTLFAHEATPGHHFQLALAQETPGFPEFRKFFDGDFNAHTEGWALYAERLGYEMNFYEDHLSKFGQLSDEMMRAVRLLVDTGIHQFGMTRDQAIQYFKENTLHAEHDAISEIDRYISWPGQALSYKIGQMKFLSLREKAEKALGEKFDVREFHDELLTQGTLPMAMVEEIVDAWIIQQGGKI